jgi:hypothetical protein
VTYSSLVSIYRVTCRDIAGELEYEAIKVPEYRHAFDPYCNRLFVFRFLAVEFRIPTVLSKSNFVPSRMDSTWASSVIQKTGHCLAAISIHPLTLPITDGARGA